MGIVKDLGSKSLILSEEEISSLYMEDFVHSRDTIRKLGEYGVHSVLQLAFILPILNKNSGFSRKEKEDIASAFLKKDSTLYQRLVISYLYSKNVNQFSLLLYPSSRGKGKAHLVPLGKYLSNIQRWYLNTGYLYSDIVTSVFEKAIEQYSSDNNIDLVNYESLQIW